MTSALAGVQVRVRGAYFCSLALPRFACDRCAHRDCAAPRMRRALATAAAGLTLFAATHPFPNEQVLLLTQVEMSRPSSVVASSLPDCLLPVGNREVLDVQLEALEQCGVTSVYLVCPEAVVDALRSWKADVCSRKVDVVFAPFAEAFDTADALFSVRSRIVGDFIVIVGNVIFDAQVLRSAVKLHRGRDPVLTLVMQPQSGAALGLGFVWGFVRWLTHCPAEVNSEPVQLNKSMNENMAPTTYLGYASDGRLLYVRNRSAIADSLEAGKVALKKTVLRRFPDVQISSSFFDPQIYVFSKHALDLVEEKRRSITSIRQHLVPHLVKLQFSGSVPDARVEPVNPQHLAHAMSSSSRRLTNELRAYMCELPARVFVARVDTLDDFVRVNRFVGPDSASGVLPLGTRSMYKGKTVVFVGETATMDESTVIGPGCVVGPGTAIAAQCSIKKTTLGRHNRISARCKIQTTITLDHVAIGEGAVVKNSVIGSNVIIEAGSIVENAVLGVGVKTTVGQKISDTTVQ